MAEYEFISFFRKITFKIWEMDSPWALQCLVALWYPLDQLVPVHKKKNI